ncbi:MAG: hypothetical protein AABM33_00130 [Pseudomonadota bacterium]
MDAKNSNPEQTPLAEARFEAQKIAFGPMLFQTARLLRDLGILKALRAARPGLTLDEITGKVETSRYGVLALLEAGLAAGMVRCEGERYLLTHTGAMIEAAGLKVEKVTDKLGICSSLVICRRR